MEQKLTEEKENGSQWKIRFDAMKINTKEPLNKDKNIKNKVGHIQQLKKEEGGKFSELLEKYMKLQEKTVFENAKQNDKVTF